MSASLHPAARRAEGLLMQIASALTRWRHGQKPRPAEIDEVTRLVGEARQEIRSLDGAPVRPAIPAAVRRRVVARAAGHCEACRAPIDDTNTHVDHITPVARFGASTEDNLRALCASCNLSKGARELS